MTVNHGVLGSSPSWGAIYNYGLLVKRLTHMPFTNAFTGLIPVQVPSGGLAQLGEHLPYKQRVGGSSPSISTMPT